MRAPPTAELITLALLGTTATVTFLLPDTLSVTATMGAPPPTIRLPGVVRDFSASHPDFAVLPAEGAGHYARNAAVALAAGRPIFNVGSDHNGPLAHRIAHWKLDDGAGSIAVDEVGTNPGTLAGGPTWATGTDGGGLHFDGVNDYVNVPSSPEMQIKGDITFTGWFKLDNDFDASSADTLVIMEKFLDTEHDFHIALAGNDYNRPEVPKGTIVFKVENGPTSDYYRYVWTTRASWTAGVWYHFAAALVSADTSQNRLFVNGVDDTDPVTAGGVGFVDTDYDAPMRFGGKTIDYNGLATNIFFEGTLDDIMIFDRALADADFVRSEPGFRVGLQWQDAAGNNIAPHLAAVGGDNVLRLVSAPTISDTAIFDSWDSSAGPYGAPNVGPAPAIETGAAMPVVTLPSGMPPNSGRLDFDSTAPTIDRDYTCGTLVIKDTVTVVGDVRILCHGSFTVSAAAVLRLAPGATLTVWVEDKLDVQPQAQVNVNTADPMRTTFYALGDKDVSLGNPASMIYATVVAPNTTMTCSAHSEFYGRFTGVAVDVHNHAQFHYDATQNLDACDVAIQDSLGTRGVMSTGGITSEYTFDQWFRDVLGVNMSAMHAITLEQDGAGVWFYVDDAFYPVDGRLLGSEGDTHNNNFTYAVQASFQYRQCWSQFIEFEGGDGVWLFVNGEMVLDMGGVDSGLPQYIALDRLGLTDGETCRLDLFYAERDASSSVFRLRTNVDLTPTSTPPTVSAPFD